MNEKKFFLPEHSIRPNLAPHRGSCFASDLITVQGYSVGFMVREEPYDEHDSGWRFFAGTESKEYCDDMDNFGIYDVNTIANYDSAIIPFLDADYDSSFERDSKSQSFIRYYASDRTD
jgi:hypothetical protein